MDIRLSDIKNSITLTANINGKRQTREIVLKDNEARKTLISFLAAFFDTNKISKKDEILDEKEQAAFFAKLTNLHLINPAAKKQTLTSNALSIMKEKLFGKKPDAETSFKNNFVNTLKGNEIGFSIDYSDIELIDRKDKNLYQRLHYPFIDKKTGKIVRLTLVNKNGLLDTSATELELIVFSRFIDADHNKKLSAKEMSNYYEKIKEFLPAPEDGYTMITTSALTKMVLKYYSDKIDIGILTQNLRGERSQVERFKAQEMLRNLGLYGGKEIKNKILEAFKNALVNNIDLDQQAAIADILGDIDDDGKCLFSIIEMGKRHPEKVADTLSTIGFNNQKKIIPLIVRVGISYAYAGKMSERYDTEAQRDYAIRDFKERTLLAKALGDTFIKIGAPSVKYLTDALKPPPESTLTPEARRAAVKIITAMFDDYEKNPKKLCGCGKKHSKFKYEFEHVKAEISSHKKIIAECLKSNNPKLRLEAMNLLMRFKLHKDMLGYIELALSDTEPEVCRKAANAAGRMNISGNTKIIESLKNLLKSPHKEVQTEAAKALKKISWHCVKDIADTALTTANPDARIKVLNILNGFSGTELKAAVPHLIKMLKYTQPAPNPEINTREDYIFFTKEEQGAAAQLLIKIGPPAIAALTNEITEARRAGKYLPISMSVYIAKISGEVCKNHPKSINNEIRNYLRYMVSCKSGLFARAREAAVTALGKIREGADLLLDCYLYDNDPYVRDKAYKALINAGPAALPEVITFLNNSRGNQNADPAKIAKTLVNLITEIAKKHPDDIGVMKTQLQAVSNGGYPALAYFKENTLARLERIKPKIIVRNQ